MSTTQAKRGRKKRTETTDADVSTPELSVVEVTSSAAPDKCSAMMSTGQVTGFKILSEIINTTLADANLAFYSDGVHIMEHNDDKKWIFNVSMFSNMLNEYEYNSSKSKIVVGLKFDKINRYLKTAHKSNNKITMKIDSDDPDKMQLIISGNGKSSQYVITTADLPPTAHRFSMPQYAQVIAMSSTEFSTLVKNMATVGKLLDIKTVNGTVTFSTSNKQDRCATTYDTDQHIKFVKNDMPHAIMQTIIPISSINTLIKACSLTEVVMLHIENDKPFIIEFNIPNLCVLSMALLMDKTKA